METNQNEKQVRKCIVTGENHKKSEMIRLVSFRGGPIEIDISGKKEGRGCYVKADKSLLSNLLEKNGVILARTFKRKIEAGELENLETNFAAAVDEKLFRPRESKPVVVRVDRETFKKTKE